MIEGAPSVLYDAVVVLVSKEGAAALARLPAARDFISDAYAHCKFIGHSPEARSLFVAAGVGALIDDGFVALDGDAAPEAYFERCRGLRNWGRQIPALPS